MTARLLPPKDLTAMLCRYCYGETPTELAEAYALTPIQVSALVNTHRDTYRHMQKFLGLQHPRPRKQPPRPKIVPGIWRNCNRCQREFWTESRFIRSCDQCKTRDDWRHGTDLSTVPLRGMG